MSDESPQEMNRRAAVLRPTLYPELETEELGQLVRRLVGESGYSLDAVSTGQPLRVGERTAQTSCAAFERLFIFDLWSKGVSYANGRTADPRAMADAIGAFVIGRATVDEMERRYPFIEFNSNARPHEAGRLVDECWRSRLERHDDVGLLLGPLLRSCANRPRLRGLLPFTSHETLLFSRTTGYPYDAMLVCARPVFDPARPGGGSYLERFVPGTYEVFLRDAQPTEPSELAERTLGRGDAEWAAAVLEREVPGSWGAAVDGTAED